MKASPLLLVAATVFTTAEPMKRNLEPIYTESKDADLTDSAGIYSSTEYLRSCSTNCHTITINQEPPRPIKIMDHTVTEMPQTIRFIKTNEAINAIIPQDIMPQINQTHDMFASETTLQPTKIVSWHSEMSYLSIDTIQMALQFVYILYQRQIAPQVLR